MKVYPEPVLPEVKIEERLDDCLRTLRLLSREGNSRSLLLLRSVNLNLEVIRIIIEMLLVGAVPTGKDYYYIK